MHNEWFSHISKMLQKDTSFSLKVHMALAKMKLYLIVDTTMNTTKAQIIEVKTDKLIPIYLAKNCEEHVVLKSMLF